MTDGNVIVLSVEPRIPTGEIEKYLDFYGLLGHEFAGHGLNNYNLFKDYVGQKDQFDNTIDGSGHVNSPALWSVFNGSTSNHLRFDRANTTLIFPQEDKEYYSAYKQNFEPKNIEEDKTYYANLKLMKTPSEKSNIPYIADFVKNARMASDKFMKEMWTDKILKGGRTATNSDYVTIKSIISCK